MTRFAHAHKCTLLSLRTFVQTVRVFVSFHQPADASKSVETTKDGAVTAAATTTGGESEPAAATAPAAAAATAEQVDKDDAAIAAAPSEEDSAAPDAAPAAEDAVAAETAEDHFDMTKADEEKEGGSPLTDEQKESKYQEGPSRMASHVSVLSSVPSIGSMAPLPVSSSAFSDAACLSDVVDDPAPMEGENDEQQLAESDSASPLSAAPVRCTFSHICGNFQAAAAVFAHLYGMTN